MGYLIDHLVILVNDLDAAKADYAALGFVVVPGGEHSDGATHNALVAFADGSYLELIAFQRAEPAHSWWRHTQVGEGLIDVALLPGAIEADLAAARERGLVFEGPLPGGRLRPDGQAIQWQLGRPPTSDLPFLCADVTPRALRVPDGPAWQHANRVTGIADLTIAVANLEASAARYQALLGSPAETPPQSPLPNTRAARFILGSATITLLEPLPASASDHPVQQRLAQRGEGPCAVALRAGTQKTLDITRTHGVPITFVV